MPISMGGQARGRDFAQLNFNMQSNHLKLKVRLTIIALISIGSGGLIVRHSRASTADVSPD